jgi:hypothetical protein
MRFKHDVCGCGVSCSWYMHDCGVGCTWRCGGGIRALLSNRVMLDAR